MSKQSEKVKRWRKACKTRIVEAMGGSCCVCRYNKCFSALALHHINPHEKDFSLGKARANIKSWAKIVKELRKCVLICNNCHSEIHEGITFIPMDASSFNEKYVDYSLLEAADNQDKLMSPCPVCQKLKPKHLKNCSVQCAAISKYKVDWNSINLEEELKTKSIVKIAEEIGCSDGAIHKRLRKMGLK